MPSADLRSKAAGAVSGSGGEAWLVAPEVALIDGAAGDLTLAGEGGHRAIQSRSMAGAIAFQWHGARNNVELPAIVGLALKFIFSGLDDLHKRFLESYFQDLISVDWDHHSFRPAFFRINMMTAFDSGENPTLCFSELSHPLAGNGLHTAISRTC